MNLTVIKGDITTVHANAIVNAANLKMRGGGGVDGAIHKAAGPRLLAYESWMYPHGLPGVGCPAATPGFDLPAKYIIHVAGPDRRPLNAALGDCYLRDAPATTRAVFEHDDLLWNSYARSLVLAGLLGAQSVAFPSISTGTFGFPLARATAVALDAIETTRWRAPSVDVVSFVAFDDETFGAFKAGLG